MMRVNNPTCQELHRFHIDDTSFKSCISIEGQDDHLDCRKQSYKTFFTENNIRREVRDVVFTTDRWVKIVEL